MLRHGRPDTCQRRCLLLQRQEPGRRPPGGVVLHARIGHPDIVKHMHMDSCMLVRPRGSRLEVARLALVDKLCYLACAKFYGVSNSTDSAQTDYLIFE